MFHDENPRTFLSGVTRTNAHALLARACALYIKVSLHGSRPLGTFDRMIYSEIGLCIICGFGGVMKPARGPRTFGLAAQDVHTIIKVIPHDPQQRHLRARPHSPATHIRNRRATWKQRKHYGDAEQSKNWARTSNTMMLKKGGPSRHERFQ